MRPSARSPRWRLFLTVWLVYSVFATTNVVRETYLAIALGTSGTVRVDRYLGLPEVNWAGIDKSDTEDLAGGSGN